MIRPRKPELFDVTSYCNHKSMAAPEYFLWYHSQVRTHSFLMTEAKITDRCQHCHYFGVRSCVASYLEHDR